MLVNKLGGWVKNRNTHTQTFRMVRASDGVEVVGERVTVKISGASCGHFLYGTLAVPVTLESSTS